MPAMKIIEPTQFGPTFRFSDANVYWALHTLSDGRRIGRKRLAEIIGVGEGSMRKIVDTLKERNLISVRQTGITITKVGQVFLDNVPIKVVDVKLEESVVGMYSQGILVMGVAEKVHNGMQQRDAGIKAGAAGCTTIVIRDGSLTVPPDWNIDEKDPDNAYIIRRDTGITQNDIIIIGSADTKILAIEAAVKAAFELI